MLITITYNLKLSKVLSTYFLIQGFSNFYKKNSYQLSLGAETWSLKNLEKMHK